MAEIHIERKTRKKPVWPWVLLLLVVLGVVAWLMLADNPTVVNDSENELKINYQQELPDKLAYVFLQ
uniref:Uncharacterized protein n=1 Tax=Roseihalotalea indica TaxID=2867963 RepID=A0AA49JF49_9BACT|nr:hypothetical protein K4G66_05195 [Tunicatimonas sp. TK19036]